MFLKVIYKYSVNFNLPMIPCKYVQEADYRISGVWGAPGWGMEEGRGLNLHDSVSAVQCSESWFKFPGSSIFSLSCQRMSILILKIYPICHFCTYFEIIGLQSFYIFPTCINRSGTITFNYMYTFTYICSLNNLPTCSFIYLLT